MSGSWPIGLKLGWIGAFPTANLWPENRCCSPSTLGSRVLLVQNPPHGELGAVIVFVNLYQISILTSRYCKILWYWGVARGGEVARLMVLRTNHVQCAGFIRASFEPKRSKIRQEMADLWPNYQREVVWLKMLLRVMSGIHKGFIWAKKI